MTEKCLKKNLCEIKLMKMFSAFSFLIQEKIDDVFLKVTVL